ncbi:transcription factor IIIA [Ricinus communis]|uniref:Zinc finger protein, putative n=1 Tax=Ricinus communis TaxID=3988 RepID=B9T5R4_RICCO|nr:transcription factor IIIA [Ricinus communis]EEF28801.1 zinc finger protein, putative [Ricinus communis]|eukprot:XP_002533583.1 transcription factor IIIA [Ricinus communis]
MEETAESEIPRPIFRDIRRYFCDYCGICRSKKSLITSHIQTHHKEEMNKDKSDEGVEADGVKSNTCAECGANFKKAAYLRQHMRSHSLERPYVCSVDDCQASYRRKDHLNRHLLIHKGKLFKCPIENCYREFVVQGNVKRHVKELHCESSPCAKIGEKQHVCQESGCGKVFRYLSKLRKHEDSHVKLDAVEAICLESGCMKHFSNSQCLRAHIQSCHRYTTCEICGTKQLKKNLKRHLRTHESGGSSVERIKCQFKDCCHTFSNKTNLNQHVKAVHLEVKPFACGIPGCDKRFSFKHVRDNHEKSGCHVYTPGDFEESDEQFRSRPRGGRKRKCPTVEMLIRKRVTPPADLDEYLTWFQSMASEEQS